MTVKRCPGCNTPVEWLKTSYGRRLPFNHELVDKEQLGDTVGWVTEIRTRKGRRFVVLVPLAGVSSGKRDGVKRAAILHQCGHWDATILEILNSHPGDSA
jgi:hypothetical protein